MKYSYYFKLFLAPFSLKTFNWQIWASLILTISCQFLFVYMSVFINEWQKLFYDALQQFDGEAALHLIFIYIFYLSIVVLSIVVGSAFGKILVFLWRRELNNYFSDKWLDDHRHYMLRFNQYPDNPDQRIAEDIRLFTAESVFLFKSLLTHATRLLTFIVILWNLSPLVDITLNDAQYTLHGYVFWIALAYGVISTLIIHWIGKILLSLNIDRQHREADYRAKLIRLTEKSEEVAFYNGEASENKQQKQLFDAIGDNWFQIIKAEIKLESITAFQFRLTNFIPIIAVLPFFLNKTITFGDVMQIQSAFAIVADGFGWIATYYKRLIEWSSFIKRLAEFDTALNICPIATKNNQSDNDRSKQQGNHKSAFLSFKNVQLFYPDKTPLGYFPDIRLEKSDWLLVDGKSGAGKTTFLRYLAGLWPFCQGDRALYGRMLFLPQTPYLFKGSLRTVISYPAKNTYDDEIIKDTLNLLSLNLGDKIDHNDNWQQILSGGEQQRLSVARAILYQPDILFLDEATNQLDHNNALQSMSLLKKHCPNTIVICITHQDEIKTLFNQKLIKNNKKWTLQIIN
ncbi:ABC transporter ATP-binding protein/permease [Bartonella sp. HY038]|uniref:ABC transporter ATP-binding protein/permease n=1 Tax=Bartonella sp. HY038 TaxID=2759660 RepID=UPI0015FB7BAF|nr:SbmA/BacA-like family transporter [Bartonella sp. HY038]